MLKYILSCFLLCCSVFSFAQSVQEDTYYSYNSDGYVSQEKKAQSNGDILITNYRYPADYNIDNSCTTNSLAQSSTLGILNLLKLNIRNVPIETYTEVQKPNGNIYVTGGKIYVYNKTLPYPDRMYQMELAAPLSSSQFTPFTYNASLGNCSMTIDGDYVTQEIYEQYDVYGNLLEKQTKSGEYISYLYFFKGAYKVAEVVNATSNEIAYTSFETTDQGNWNYTATGIIAASTPIAGGKCYALSAGAITSNTLPANNYLVSFWTSVGNAFVSNSTSSVTGPTINGWTYHEYKTNNNVTSVTIIGTSANIDELRLYPQNAQMQTINYTPLIGMNYTCDVADHLTYYEYDDLNRLTVIRDQNGNIVKKYEYGLQTQE